MRVQLETRRIALLRHGETAGQSSIRYYGATDVPLSDEGRAQLRAARPRVGNGWALVAASSLTRAWEGARIVAPGRRIRLMHELREIDFGRWEGLTADEIEARDPELYAQWRERGAHFDYPGGEARARFRARIEHGLEQLLASGAPSLLLVAHKGVVRTITERLSGEVLAPDEPKLAGVVRLVRGAGGDWRLRS